MLCTLWKKTNKKIKPLQSDPFPSGPVLHSGVDVASQVKHFLSSCCGCIENC